MRISKYNRKKAQYLISLLNNPECFAPASLQGLLQWMAAKSTMQWISLSRNNNVFLHSCCPGANWLIEEIRKGIVMERFDPPFFEKGYIFEYVGTVVGRAVARPNRPALITVHGKLFKYLLDEQANAAAAAKERHDKAAMQAAEALSQLPGVTSSDAWI